MCLPQWSLSSNIRGLSMINGEFNASNIRRDYGTRIALALALILGLFSIFLNFTDYQITASYVGLVAAWALIYGGNLHTDERHRQWSSVLVAVVLCVFALVSAIWLRTSFDSFVVSHAALLDRISSLLSIQIPRDFRFALPWLNMSILILMGILKLLISASARAIRIILKPNASKVASSPNYGAYDFLPGRGWRLIPKWEFAKHLCAAFTCMFALILISFWMVFDSVWSSVWIPILPACGLILFGEISAYLGGITGDVDESSFDGEAPDITVFANYEAVWKAMRKVWPDSWLASADRSIWGDKS